MILSSISTLKINLDCPNQYIEAGSCYNLINKKTGEVLSFGKADKPEINLQKLEAYGENEKVCVSQGNGDNFFLHWLTPKGDLVFDLGESGKIGEPMIKSLKVTDPKCIEQQFKLKNTINYGKEFILYAVSTGHVMGINKAGIVTQQSMENRTNQAQIWIFEPITAPEKTVTSRKKPVPAPKKPVPVVKKPVKIVNAYLNGCYNVISKTSGEMLSYGNPSKLEIELKPKSSLKSGKNEIVCVEKPKVGDYYFLHWKVNFKKVFDIRGGGIDLIKYNKHGGKNQRFEFVKLGKNKYLFIAKHSLRAFARTSKGVTEKKVDVNDERQVWILVPVKI